MVNINEYYVEIMYKYKLIRRTHVIGVNLNVTNMHYVNANMCKVEAATLVQSLQSVASLRLKQQDRRADCRRLPVLYFLVVEIYFLLLRRGS